MDLEHWPGVRLLPLAHLRQDAFRVQLRSELRRREDHEGPRRCHPAPVHAARSTRPDDDAADARESSDQPAPALLSPPAEPRHTVSSAAVRRLVGGFALALASFLATAGAYVLALRAGGSVDPEEVTAFLVWGAPVFLVVVAPLYAALFWSVGRLRPEAPRWVYPALGVAGGATLVALASWVLTGSPSGGDARVFQGMAAAAGATFGAGWTWFRPTHRQTPHPPMGPPHPPGGDRATRPR